MSTFIDEGLQRARSRRRMSASVVWRTALDAQRGASTGRSLQSAFPELVRAAMPVKIKDCRNDNGQK